MEEHDGFDFLPFLYGELLSQLAGSYCNVAQELWMIRGEISKIWNKLVSHSSFKRMNSADPTFDDIRISLNLLKHCFIRLSQEVGAQLEVPLRPAMTCKLNILTDHHISFDFSSINRKALATIHTAHFGPWPFSNTSSLLLHHFLFA